MYAKGVLKVILFWGQPVTYAMIKKKKNTISVCSLRHLLRMTVPYCVQYNSCLKWYQPNLLTSEKKRLRNLCNICSSGFVWLCWPNIYDPQRHCILDNSPFRRGSFGVEDREDCWLLQTMPRNRKLLWYNWGSPISGTVCKIQNPSNSSMTNDPLRRVLSTP